MRFHAALRYSCLLLLLTGCVDVPLPRFSEASSWRPVSEPVSLEANLRIKDETSYEYKVIVSNNTKVDLVIGVLITVSMGEQTQSKELYTLVPAYRSKTLTDVAAFDKLVWNKKAEITVKTTHITETMP